LRAPVRGGTVARTLVGYRKERSMPNQSKSFDQPEETRSFDNGKVDLVEIAGSQVGRAKLEPGWRWSEAVKPIVGTDSCQVAHVGYAISGRLHVKMDDGTEIDIKAGDVYEIAPGHDAWVDGDETFSGVEFQSLAEYAKG
jgi:mannose-6-phosphate isomerase-like protein (cupin superfamily)